MCCWIGLLLLTACGGCEEPGKKPLPDANPDIAANVNNINNANNANHGTPTEIAIVELPLSGDAAGALAEYSALAWFGDTLILVPQYPSRFDHRLVALEKSQILAYLDGAPASALAWRTVPFDDGGLRSLVSGFEGFEALGFSGSSVYMTVETGTSAGAGCFVVRGSVSTEPQLSITLDPQSLRAIALPVQLENMCHEALLVLEDRVVTFYEANGVHVNPDPGVQVFDPQLAPLAVQPMAQLEYRLTDVTPVDAAGRFWAVNYFYTGEADLLDPAPDPLAAMFGEGPTHAASEAVERLVELVWTPAGVTHSGAAPIPLRLEADARNWEGLARLDDRGFLIVTDKFPTSILAFVPFPGK